MNSFQLFCSVRPSSNLVVRRYAFTQKDRIILLNYQNKSLYGPVIKKKPAKSSVKIKKVDSLAKPVTTETSYGSEMYWVIGNRWNEIFDKSCPKTSDDSTVKKVSQLTLKKQAKVSTNDKENTADCNTKKPATVVQKPILLSNDQLDNVLKHPLQSKILSAPPTDIRDPKLRNVPSVGRVLQYTMSEAARNALLNWKLTKISELGEQGFAELQQSNLNSGAAFHGSLQQYFLTNEMPIDSSPVYKVWESVKHVLDTFTAMPVLVEKPVFHPTLQYKGICDCISEVDNQLTIIEWKKSGRLKPTLGIRIGTPLLHSVKTFFYLDETYDAPLQLCGYLGAVNSIPEFQGRIRQGMVVVAYENGKQADVYKMNEVMLRKYWRVWLARLHEFWVRSRDDTLPEPI